MSRKEKVTKVIDGDTFLTSSRKNAIRLANVDAPEIRQKGGLTAKKSLSDLILGETVSIDTKARDVYGRSVANVKLGRISINKAVKDKINK